MNEKGFPIEKFKEFPITYSLILLNLILFLLSTLGADFQEKLFQEGALSGYYVVLKEEHYRLFTSMFLHNDMIHITMNMLSLYMIGTMVERLFKSWAYIGIYFMSGLFGNFASMYMHPTGWAVGASGAIFGIFGALAGFAFVHRNTMHGEFMQFMRSFGVVLLINFFIGIVFPSIDMSAHVGGLIGGVVGGLLVAKNLNFLWVYLVLGVGILLTVYDYLPSLYVSL